MLDARTIHKKEKFKALDAGDMFTARVKDKQQMNDKKAANSGYGAEGQSSSFLYNIHSAMSVTASGRGQISTACQCFENLFSDNSVKFFDMNEFFTWVYNIINEKPQWKFSTDDVIDRYPSRKEFINRFVKKFNPTDCANVDMIGSVYDHVDKEMAARIYYKANIREFLLNFTPMDIFSDIAVSDVDYIDPNKIPDKIKGDVNKLVDMVVEFVNYQYSMFRYEDRTRYQPRQVAIVIDTDSNFLAFGPVIDYILSEVLPMKLFRSKKEYESYKLRILNVLPTIATAAITQTLFNYLGHVNVPEEDRPKVNMKNEFYYSRVMVTFAKKSYIGLQKRQEAHIFTTPRLDVKGVNFFKSTASESTSKFIYDKILINELLQPDDGKISLRRTYETIYNFQKEMADKISHGDMGYLKRAIKVKSPDAYANPMSNGNYKAVYVWNRTHGEKEQIEFPAIVTLVKVQLRNKADVAKLEQWPEIYQKMMDLFENDPEIGDYMEDGKLVKGKGIKSIALPPELEEVPEWVLPIIDVETLVNDNMKLMTQIFRPLGMSRGNITHSGASLAYYTNIVRI